MRISKAGGQPLSAHELRLAGWAEFLAWNAVMMVLASAVTFLVVLGMTRELALAAVVGSPVVIAIIAAVGAVGVWARLGMIRRRVAAAADLNEDRVTGIVDGVFDLECAMGTLIPPRRGDPVCSQESVTNSPVAASNR